MSRLVLVAVALAVLSGCAGPQRTYFWPASFEAPQ